MGVGVLYPVAATAASTFSDKPRCENDINPRIGPPAMRKIELGEGAGRPNLPQLRRNIGSNGVKSTCNGLPQGVKLNGLLHFLMTPGEENANAGSFAGDFADRACRRAELLGAALCGADPGAVAVRPRHRRRSSA